MEYLDWIAKHGVGLTIAALVIGPGIGWFILEIIKQIKKWAYIILMNQNRMTKYTGGL